MHTKGQIQAHFFTYQGKPSHSWLMKRIDEDTQHVIAEINIKDEGPIDTLTAMDNARRLAKCWNEHDALKAKAELFDEATDIIDRLCDSLDNQTDRWIGAEAAELIVTANKFLDKAKELT